MPSKTNTDKIDDLSKLVATLTERLDNVRREMEGVAGLTARLAELATKVALLEQQGIDLRNRADEASRRRWSVVPALVGAVLGGLITLGGQAVLKRWLP